ncbi:MAG: Pr6Pr family membrane protein [Bacilli bacterium]
MKKYLVVIYRAILLILIIIGIIFNFIAKNYDLNMLLSYYTVQSNIIVAIFLLLEIINSFKKIKLFEKEETYQNIKGMITLIILITGLIFAVILAPYVKNWTGYRLYSSYLLHYVSPLMVLIDFLFFDKPTTNLSIKKNIFWFIYPVMYYLIGIIRILFIDGFIPYPFMDVKGLGYIKSLGIFIFLLLIFYFISIVLIWLKNAISKIMK